MTVNEILERIEENGFEAYIVGGYVRDYLLGIESTDIDICTNARVKDILDIFDDMHANSNEYGAVKIITDKVRIDITTYRRDIKYNGNRRSVEMEYVDNLVDDIQRRDFTMNTLCMNKEGNIIDLFNGKADIENKIIRCVGDINDRINEDPLRMLRAVRFATTLGFTIEEELYNSLKENKELINELSLDRIKDELGKILISQNCIKGMDYLRRLGFLDIMGISYDKLVNVSDICGMFSQLTFNKEYPFSKEEKKNIKDIQEIVEKGVIDKRVLFDYGCYVSIVAGSILGMSAEEICDIDKDLVIKSISDIDIKSEEICKILGVKPSKIIGNVYNELKNLIIDDKLDNAHEVICEYIYENRRRWLHEGLRK